MTRSALPTLLSPDRLAAIRATLASDDALLYGLPVDDASALLAAYDAAVAALGGQLTYMDSGLVLDPNLVEPAAGVGALTQTALLRWQDEVAAHTLNLFHKGPT